jgi:hypothetical protein
MNVPISPDVNTGRDSSLRAAGTCGNTGIFKKKMGSVFARNLDLSIAKFLIVVNFVTIPF